MKNVLNSLQASAGLAHGRNGKQGTIMKIRSGVAGCGVVVAAVLTILLNSVPISMAALPPPDHTVLLDFGNNKSYRGTNTPSPDIHGHYWNSVWSGTFYPHLTNAAGGATTLAVGFSSGLAGDTDSYNGPSGVCTGDVPCPPSACVIDTNALGYLGINEAVYDFYVNSGFQIQGANPTKTYALTFFGSRKFSASDYTIYSICSDASYSTVLTSVTLYVQNPSDPSSHNSNTVATISGVSPQANGIFYIMFTGTNSTILAPGQVGGYLNCMQIVDLTSTNTPPPPPPPANATILLDFGNNQSFRSTNTPSPDIRGHYWNSVDNGQFFPVLTNAAGGVTTLAFGFDASSTNDIYFAADSYNGPHPELYPSPDDPSTCIIDTNALGYLGINEAVFDYYVNARFQIQGMDPAKTYSLSFFGSHEYQPDNVTVYSLYSDASYSTVLTSATLTVGGSGYWNLGSLAVLGSVSPRTDGIMYIGFSASSLDPDNPGSYFPGYLNCMQIVDLSLTNGNTSPFVAWQTHYFGGTGGSAVAGADPDGDGFSNTNEFLAGFNPINSAAYPHIISITRSGPTNLVVTYLGANGDNTWTPGVASRTNVLEFTTGTPNHSYSNNFVSTGQTNILSGGTGVGIVTSFIETNVVTGPARYYRVRVLTP